MCGIAAIYKSEIANQDWLRRTIHAMTDEMSHRGPDGEGHYINEHVALGHRRLAILDLSPAGAQPMFGSNDRTVIVFNGEIYNYLELNALLETKGYKAKSTSDTETLLNLYDAFGEDCLKYLRGMFAFVLWDKQSKTVFAARDRFGIKPLYYSHTPQGIVFASELKGILKSGLVEKKLNHRAIDTLFETGSVRQPETMIEKVFHLPPATAVRIQDGKWNSWQYWDISFQTNEIISYDEAKSELRRLFFETLNQHLISDVPLGVFLSGGIDSSLIVAAMKSLGQETKTYSVGFDLGKSSYASEYNETHHAKRVAEMYGTTHTEVILSESEILADLDKIVFGIDQPSSDGLNSYVVSKVSKPHVTVALSGLGSDELFGGYTLFKFAQRLEQMKSITNRLPAFVGKVFAGIEDSLPYDIQESWQWRGARAIAGGYESTADLYQIRHLTTDSERDGLFTNQFNHSLHSFSSASEYRSLLSRKFMNGSSHHEANRVAELSFLELKFYMMNTLLRDADAMSMINSLEVRVPFLDHVLAEFVAKLPSEFKIDERSKNTGKKILIDTFSDFLPDEIVHRKKMGFVFPLGVWMKSGKFREVIGDALIPSRVRDRGIFNPDELNHIQNEFFSSDDNSTRSYRAYLKIWMATLLELWMQRFI